MTIPMKCLSLQMAKNLALSRVNSLAFTGPAVCAVKQSASTSLDSSVSRRYIHHRGFDQSRSLWLSSNRSNIAAQSNSEKSDDGKLKRMPRSLLEDLVSKIKFTGPITVAEYMKYVLTHPIAGFYMGSDVFGSKGHFTTSPEISQVFGELIAIWIISEWQRVGSPKPFRIIELGPGRGTLASDISRVLSQFSSTRDNSSIHLVEISPVLTQIQEKALCDEISVIEQDRSNRLHHSLSKNGIPVTWYQSIDELSVTSGFNAFIANEFFDALPIHKFQRHSNGNWHEVLIDYTTKEETNEQVLRYVLSKNPTPASESLIRFVLPDPNSTEFASIKHMEVCSEAGIIVDKIMDRINQPNTSGCALICDYGYNELIPIRDTFRGFKKHQLVDPLIEPGLADLTADVDFAFLRSLVARKSLAFGPVNQKHFLQSMGIQIRLQVTVHVGH